MTPDYLDPTLLVVPDPLSACCHTCGPVPKLDDEVLVCTLPISHEGDHDNGSAWWVDSAGRSIATEPARIYTAVAVDMDFAHVRARYDQTDYRSAPAGCPRCGQVGGQPCLTRSGRPTRRHVGRGRSS